MLLMPSSAAVDPLESLFEPAVLRAAGEAQQEVAEAIGEPVAAVGADLDEYARTMGITTGDIVASKTNEAVLDVSSAVSHVLAAERMAEERNGLRSFAHRFEVWATKIIRFRTIRKAGRMGLVGAAAELVLTDDV